MTYPITALKKCYSIMACAIFLAVFLAVFLMAPFLTFLSPANAQTALLDMCKPPVHLTRNWHDTDFSKCTIDLMEIISGGVQKDGIPPIDTPIFRPNSEANIAEREPVISAFIAGEAKAYPLSILTWHEIVNDVIGNKNVAVTYCPLCNTTIIFDRNYQGTLLDFGTTGSLRHSDLVMYDRQTESFWQQYNGDAIAGDYAGAQLAIVPSRLESFAEYKARHPNGKILAIPTEHIRSYGINPYIGYDSAQFPFLYNGEVPSGIKPLERVVVIGDEAIALPFLQDRGTFQHGDYHISWHAGQASALDRAVIAEGRDVGTVTVQRREDHAKLVDVPYKVTFAFVFHAFAPDSPIIGVAP